VITVSAAILSFFGRHAGRNSKKLKIAQVPAG